MLVFLFLIVSSLSSDYLCSPGSFFDIQHCQACLPNCICTSMGGCNSCISGYTMYNGNCVQCPQANGIYGTCSQCCSKTTGTYLSCTDCLAVPGSYTFLYSGRCLISPGCFQIDTNGFCTECFPGYFQLDNLCQACSVSCATCTDSSNCLTCSAGYYWGVSNGGLCTACPAGCGTCDSTNLCFSCIASYYLYQNHCLSCPSLCKSCTDGSTCTACLSGILVSNLCILCTDTTYGGSVGCSVCVDNNNFIKCTQCQDTYFLDSNGVCQTCSSFIPGSVRCRDQSIPTQCISDSDPILANRYYLVGITCIQNTKNCRKIADVYGNCSICYSGYTLTSGTCTQCPFTGCQLSGSSVVANICTCTSCLTGYYLNGIVCSACSTANCAICPNNICSACKANFYLNIGVCVASSVSNCDQSATALTCTTCSSGYYKGSDNKCYNCQSNCLTCTSRYFCTLCSNGYYLHSSGICISMPSNCKSINSSYKCILCNYGYYLKQGSCLPCQLDKCEGFCPIDYYIQSLVVVNSIYHIIYLFFFSCLLLIV